MVRIAELVKLSIRVPTISAVLNGEISTLIDEMALPQRALMEVRAHD
jgi:hypothetical protein